MLETYQPWIISKSWYYVRKLISLCRIVLFDVDFQSHFIQVTLNAFAYLVQVAQITSARYSLCSKLGYMLRGMALTPHAIMPRSWKMWLEANITNVSLGTSSVYYKSPWSLSHSKGTCLIALTIAFCSL